MQSLVYDGALRLTQFDEPVLQPDQALLKIRRAGICNTDLELIAGYKAFSGILGHEFVGEVVHGSPEWVGKRVVGEINVADETCDFCRHGIPSQCRHRTTVGIYQHPGAFSERLALTEHNLHAVPDSVSDDAAVFVEPLAAALQILEAVHISPRDRVLILGAGKLGLLCAQVLRLTGADVRVVIRREKQREMLDQWGIPAVYRTELESNHTPIVVDCTGTPAGFADSIELVQPRGTVVLKSTYRDMTQADLTRVVVDEVRLVGSRCGPFDAALRLLAAGLVDVEPLIEARYPFNRALEAMQHAAQPGALKVLLDF